MPGEALLQTVVHKLILVDGKVSNCRKWLVQLLISGLCIFYLHICLKMQI